MQRLHFGRVAADGDRAAAAIAVLNSAWRRFIYLISLMLSIFHERPKKALVGEYQRK